MGFLWIIAGFIGFILLYKKGYSTWMFVGFLMVGSMIAGPLALAYGIFATSKVRQCPKCAEKIKAAAQICPHCRENISANLAS